MGNLSLRPVSGVDEMRRAWEWMQANPHLYRDNEGFASFEEFSAPPDVLRYFSLLDNGELIGLASFRLEGKKSCRFGLIAPSNPQFRAITPLLDELQRQFFEDFGGEALWIYVPPETHHVAQKLVAWFGWKKLADGLFTLTVFDYLKANNVYQENTTSRATSH